MMTQSEQAKAAKKFSQDWKGKGYEKGESQKFWLDLLCNVFGVQDFADFITFEDQVKLDHTSFIDGYISATRVLIEQKSLDKNLREPIKQSDGSFLTPFQQAKRYITELPVSKHPRWVVTSNFKSFLVYDMENPNGEPEEILLENLEKEFYRLSFITATESVHLKKELEISKKAGDIIGEIYDAILEQYKDVANPSPETLKSLNMLCVRIVFCLYAEDAGIFGHKSMFGDYLKSFEAKDLRRALLDLFQTLDQKIEERDEYLEESLAAFPYVNGGLFTEEDRTIPQLTEEIKDLLVRHASSDFDWSEISPTIFGAIFESTLNPETRRSGGMHYTSIENIHKVIDPLFLDDLKTEFERLKEIKSKSTREQKIIEFQKKLGSLKFLDPACGSGNFLTETYLSLRKLENECLKIRFDGQSVLDVYNDTVFVKIHQFYGIEINDFAVVVAKTALWIAESQMMRETSDILRRNLEFLPLKSYANIIEGNSLKMNWSTLSENAPKEFLYAEKLNVYKVDKDFGTLEVHAPVQDSHSKRIFDELNVIAKKVEEKKLPEAKLEPVIYDYIIGNPPFVGYGFQSDSQKKDTLSIYSDEKGKPYKTAGKIDYVSNWFFKASEQIQGTKTKCAFVATNSITQGEQVASVWRPIFERFGIHIDFAYQTFKWGNEGTKKNMAAVHCVIIGFSCHADCRFLQNRILLTQNQEKNSNGKSLDFPNPCDNKKIYLNEAQFVEAKNISPYLIDSPTVWIESRSKPICNVPFMTTGNRPADGGHLIIETDEYDDFIKKEPGALKYIKNLTGAEEYINNKKRYCLWLVGANPSELRKMPLVMKRIEACRQDRMNGAEDRQKLANTPTLFREINNPSQYLIIPRVSSENRRYIPIGFLDSDTIPTDSATIISDAGLYEFGILTSSVHMAWMRAVAGRLKSDYRYSKDIVYNNFPWPLQMENGKLIIEDELSEKQKISILNSQLSIQKTAQAILDARAKFPDSSLADLYDEAVMPPELRKAHQENDKAVMAAYAGSFAVNNGFSPKMTESECVAELFKMYEKLTQKIQNVV